MQFMFDDEEGTFRFGARAMARGDVERKILEYCKKHKLPFDVAFQRMWKEKQFTTALGTPFDLSIEENRDLQLKRAYLNSIKLDSQYSDLKSKFTTLLDVENGKELDSKRKDVEFSSGLQLVIAFQSALRSAYQYFQHDMRVQDQELFLQQAQTITLMLSLDLQRYPSQLQFIENRLQELVAWIFTPSTGRTKRTNVNGKSIVEYDKQLLSKYNELVRGYLNHNAYAMSNGESDFVGPDLCIDWNLGVNCTFGENCENLKKWHEFFSHHCMKHGRPVLHRRIDHPRHPLVECKQFRATWKPVPPPQAGVDNMTFTRPDIRKVLQARANNNNNYNNNNYGFGTGRGRGNYRGRGKGGYRGRGRGRGGKTWPDKSGKPSAPQKAPIPKIEASGEGNK